MQLPGAGGTPVLHTGGAKCVYEKRDEGDFVSIYYVERREERGKEPEEIIRRLVLSMREAMKLREEIHSVFADAGVSFL
jgi:hypothetical protein